MTTPHFPSLDPAHFPPIPAQESERVAALRALAILDTEPEEEFQTLVELAAEICGTPMAAISLIDENRQWFKANVGLDVAETPRRDAFCAHAIVGNDLFLVEDAEGDPRFAQNPFVTGPGGVRFYAGVPIQSDGHNLGTLCVIDRRTRRLSPAHERALRTLSQQVEARLALRAKLAEVRAREEDLRVQRDALAALARRNRDLTSFVVHDLKNPLGVIQGNLALALRRAECSPAVMRGLRDAVHAGATLERMILDLLDIARSEDGVLRCRPAEVRVDELVRAACTAAEVYATDAGRTVRAKEPLPAVTISADPDLLRRVLANLIENGIKYGAPKGTVTVSVRDDDASGVVILVDDDGKGIAPADRGRVFEKHVQLDAAGSTQGSRGLGLAFCRVAVEAHGGRIHVEDAIPHGASFQVRLPHRAGTATPSARLSS